MLIEEFWRMLIQILLFSALCVVVFIGYNIFVPQRSVQELQGSGGKDQRNYSAHLGTLQDTNITSTKTTTTATSTPASTSAMDTTQPFVAKQPTVTMVLLLSYQRTGSSFIGNLFHHTRNKHVYYMFEPLDPVYTALYSTDMGWNVPSDIHNFHNGSHRTLPEEELAATDLMLESIYQCNMSSLPTSMLIHRFWSQFSHQMYTEPYVSCLRAEGIHLNTALNTCRKHIKHICSGHFDSSVPRLNVCRTTLYNNGSWTSTAEDMKLNGLSDTDAADFEKYFKCLDHFSSPAKACARQHMDTPCKTKNIRVVKTVRAGIHTAERLLKKWDNFKVMQSFRDPRGAARSRSLALWSQGSYEGAVLKKIAHCYCGTVLHDLNILRKLQIQYPNRVSHMIFDDFVHRPKQVSKKLLDFCKVPKSAELQRWLKITTHKPNGKSKDSRSSNLKWKDTFNLWQIRNINSECLGLYKKTDYHWPEISI